jgi:hypothetical protein
MDGCENRMLRTCMVEVLLLTSPMIFDRLKERPWLNALGVLRSSASQKISFEVEKDEEVEGRESSEARSIILLRPLEVLLTSRKILEHSPI